MFSYSFIQGKSLGGLVLEAAFINIHEAIQTHYISSVNIFEKQSFISSFCCLALSLATMVSSFDRTGIAGE